MKIIRFLIVLTAISAFISSCHNYKEDPAVLEAIRKADRVLSVTDSLNDKGVYGAVETHSPWLAGLKTDSSFIEVKCGLEGNHKPGFGYMLKYILAQQHSSEEITSFVYKLNSANSTGNEYVVKIIKLRFNNNDKEIKAAQISLPEQGSVSLPFNVIYRL